MRIAQVSPLSESVPPRGYGGTERVVHYLTEELVHAGHRVTLYASGDSQTSAELRPCASTALRLNRKTIDPMVHHVLMVHRVAKEFREFDIVHFHVDYLHFPLTSRLGIPSITTLHGRLDIEDIAPCFREFKRLPFVSISDAQRSPLPWLNWTRTIYHGLPLEEYEPAYSPGRYLAFLGRISPEKRVDRAIRIACRAGIELRIAAKVDAADRDYFEHKIRPLLGEPGIEFLGEVCGRDKEALLQGAMGLLFPIDWPEPFGLVMIEAMACGTPVVAYSGGSVTEVIDEGQTGFVVNSVAEAVSAVGKLESIDRRRCRTVFEQRFSAPRMARDYLGAYQRIVDPPCANENMAKRVASSE